jgi:hypothetical protein
MGKLKQVASVVRVTEPESGDSIHAVSDQEGDIANGQLGDFNASLTGKSLYALQIRRPERDPWFANLNKRKSSGSM